MKNLMKNTLFLMATILVLSSCAKEEFAATKAPTEGSTSGAITSENKLCSQSTLVSPKVDILMLWDNSSSFNFVTSETKSAMTQLITSVSENFDYHILSLPLVPASTAALYEGVLVAKDPSSVSGNAVSILKSKESASASLSFSPGAGSNERGVDRVTDVIAANRANGIFRQDAYTIIVLMSNEDDKGCESDTGYSACTSADRANYLSKKKTKLLCLRGNTAIDCSTSGVTSSLNSSMMRFINISPLTKCSSGLNKVNSVYKEMASTIYNAEYTNSWPKANDHLDPDVAGAFDSYDLCSISFSHIFDGVNTAIKQTLLKHKYDYWPVAGSNESVDPASIRVVRSDGKILQNRALDSSITNGYELVMDSNGAAKTVTQNTRFYPTSGEAFTGKMIKLFGADGNDKVVYPDCLTVTYQAEKDTYGYIYLANGKPIVSTIEVYLNGSTTPVPQSSTNGWEYIGLQNIPSGIDANLKVFGLPAGSPSGLLIKLNGSYKMQNTSNLSFKVYYTSAAQ